MSNPEDLPIPAETVTHLRVFLIDELGRSCLYRPTLNTQDQFVLATMSVRQGDTRTAAQLADSLVDLVRTAFPGMKDRAVVPQLFHSEYSPNPGQEYSELAQYFYVPVGNIYDVLDKGPHTMVLGSYTVVNFTDIISCRNVFETRALYLLPMAHFHLHYPQDRWEIPALHQR